MSNSDKPNVIVFFSDQQRWDTVGLHGNPLNLTPNFDMLASEGTHLHNCFSCQPVCGPARACLQTGKYATENKVWRNTIALPPEETTIAEHFKTAGYKTGYIGKWHLGRYDENDESTIGRVEPQHRKGYDYWLASNLLEFTSDAYHTRLYDDKGKEHFLPGYRVDAITDATIRYVSENKKEPFFLFTSFLEPHHQNSSDSYPAPLGYAEKYSGAWTPPDLASLRGSTYQHIGGYYGMVKRLDESLGRLVETLKSLEILENTIILFASDHGCHFKTRNWEYKRSCHESSLRIPSFLTGPGFTGGGKVKELVSLVDLVPTLLDAAGIDVPDYMQGKSFKNLLMRDRNDWPDHIFAQISESCVGRAIRTDKWKYSIAGLNVSGLKDSFADVYKEEFLYDLEADPYELVNRIDKPQYKKIKKILKNKILNKIREVEGRTPEILEVK